MKNIEETVAQVLKLCRQQRSDVVLIEYQLEPEDDQPRDTTGILAASYDFLAVS